MSKTLMSKLAFCFLFLSAMCLISCGDDPAKDPEKPQLPVKVFTRLGATLDELRAFEMQQTNRKPVSKIPQDVEEDEIWVAISNILDNNGELNAFHTVSYSGRGNSVDRVNLFMKDEETYRKHVAPWLMHHYKMIGMSKDERKVYEEKSNTKPSDTDILLAVSLVTDLEYPKRNEYKLLWIQRKDVELK